MEHICEHCGTKFSSQSNLSMHTRSAKYCLQLRGKLVSYQCEKCGKTFSKKSNQKRHTEKCKIIDIPLIEEKESELELAKSRILELECRIRELEHALAEKDLLLAENKGQIKVYKERPSVVNNTQYVNPKLLNIKCDTIEPLTIEHVKKAINSGKYTYQGFIRGEAGLVDFISNLISDEDQQRSYVCTDMARNKFHRLIETREWESDNGATFLNKIMDQLREPTLEYYGQVVDMTISPNEDRELGEFLMEKTKPIAMGIAHPNSKDRATLFNKIRTEVKNLASV